MNSLEFLKTDWELLKNNKEKIQKALGFIGTDGELKIDLVQTKHKYYTQDEVGSLLSCMKVITSSQSYGRQIERYFIYRWGLIDNINKSKDEIGDFSNRSKTKNIEFKVSYLDKNDNYALIQIRPSQNVDYIALLIDASQYIAEYNLYYIEHEDMREIVDRYCSIAHGANKDKKDINHEFRGTIYNDPQINHLDKAKMEKFKISETELKEKILWK
jgi:hypothetical protein